MIHVKVDVNVTDHPRFAEAGLAATGLWLMGLAYSRKHELDGRVPKFAVKAFGPSSAQPLANRLVTVGLWEDAGDHYLILRYSEKGNQTKADVELSKAEARARMTAARTARAARVRANTPSIPLSEVPDSDSDQRDQDLGSEKALPVNDVGPDIQQPKTLDIADPIVAAAQERREEGIELTQAQKRALTLARYREAYERGIAAGTGRPFALVLTDKSEAALIAGITAHGRSAVDGKAFRGPLLTAWIERQARQFAVFVGDLPAAEVRFYPGHQPTGWLRWLNDTPVNLPAPGGHPRLQSAPTGPPESFAGAPAGDRRMVSGSDVRALSLMIGRGGT